MEDRLAEEEKCLKRGRPIENKPKKLISYPFSFPEGRLYQLHLFWDR